MDFDPSMIKNKNEIKFTTAHLPKRNFFTRKFFIVLASLIIITLISIFPYEIGHFFGNWWQEFMNGVSLK